MKKSTIFSSLHIFVVIFTALQLFKISTFIMDSAPMEIKASLIVYLVGCAVVFYTQKMCQKSYKEEENADA